MRLLALDVVDAKEGGGGRRGKGGGKLLISSQFLVS
jgi:hypothetical protein